MNSINENSLYQLNPYTNINISLHPGFAALFYNTIPLYPLPKERDFLVTWIYYRILFCYLIYLRKRFHKQSINDLPNLLIWDLLLLAFDKFNYSTISTLQDQITRLNKENGSLKQNLEATSPASANGIHKVKVILYSNSNFNLKSLMWLQKFWTCAYCLCPPSFYLL